MRKKTTNVLGVEREEDMEERKGSQRMKGGEREKDKGMDGK